MARHTRQHSTTKIKWSVQGQEDAAALAKQTGGSARQARLLGETVWSVAHADGTHTAFMTADQGRKVGLCMYRWCPRKIEDCGYHAAGRRKGGC